MSHVNANQPRSGAGTGRRPDRELADGFLWLDKSTQLCLASFTTHSFMESLILAQDERWRRA